MPWYPAPGGGSVATLTTAQAANLADVTTGAVSGALLDAAIVANQTPGFSGTLNASLGILPVGNTIAGVPIRAGDYYVVTTSGTLPAGVVNGSAAKVGAILLALVNAPASAAGWALDANGAGSLTPYAPASVSPGQTVFPLPAIPTNPAAVYMVVNGASYYSPSDFTLSGSTVTWLNGFALAATDSVHIAY